MNAARIKHALQQIAKTDSDIKLALKEYGYPAPRVQAVGFEAFVNTIVSQQLSAKAAQSIMQRLRDCVDIISPECILSKRTSSLRKAGLSERKAEYIKGLARAIKQGEFDPDQLTSMNDQDAIDSIIKLRGFGEWSAEIYLMFSLSREDIFPANDLALQIALSKLKGLDYRPNAKQARELVHEWTPWRSAGSLFLWHYYKAVK